jgi:hypothetical protein
MQLGRFRGYNTDLLFGCSTLPHSLLEVGQGFDVEKWKNYWIEEMIEPNRLVQT